MNAGAVTKYPWIGYTSMKSNLAYVGEVVSRTSFMSVMLYIFMRLWAAVYAGSGSQTVGGLTLQQMLWYLMITESIVLSSAKVSSEVDHDVRTGRLAVQLLRPLSYVLERLSQCLGERCVRFAVNVAAGAGVAMFLAGPIRLSARGLAMFVLVLPAAFVLDFLGYFMVGLFAFWFESTVGLTLIYTRLTMLLGGMLLPLDLYPASLQPLVRALPFWSIVYGPARVFVSGDEHVFLRTMATQAVSLAVFGAAVYLIHKIALKRIQSHGG